MRNYKREYATYQGTEKQKKERAKRNNARREAIRKGQAHKGDGKDVHHVDRNPNNNKSCNKRVVSKGKNRSFSRKNERGHGRRYS